MLCKNFSRVGTERWRKLALGALVGALWLSTGRAADQDYKSRVEPVLKTYCFDCHGDGAKKGEVAFDEYTNLAAHVADHKLWLGVWQNLETQMMPPPRNRSRVKLSGI